MKLAVRCGWAVRLAVAPPAGAWIETRWLNH